MSFSEIAQKQLLKYPKTGKMLTMHYYEDEILKQIHMDTLFWERIGRIRLVPVLAIVDMATRYTKFYVQKRKNDNVKGFLTDFMKEVVEQYTPDKDKYDKATEEDKLKMIPIKFSNNVLLTTDGARELIVKGDIKLTDDMTVHVTHAVSKNMNKAVLAENAIRRFRNALRKFEAKLEMDYLVDGKRLRKINRKTLPKYIKDAEEIINKNANVKPKPDNKRRMERKYNLGDPVFIINMHKFFPFQIGANPLKKKSYERPYATEPFYVSKIIYMQGIYKYQVRSFTNNEEVKYNFYTEQIQPIDPKIAPIYIKNYVKHEQK